MTKYQAEVLIELELDGDHEAAFKTVDDIMQRAWNSDQGRRWIDQKWHFSMLEGAVIELDGVEELGDELVEIGDLDDVTDDVTVSPAAPSAPSELFVNGVCQVCGHLEGDHEKFPGEEVYTCDDACDEDLRGYCHIGRL